MENKLVSTQVPKQKTWLQTALGGNNPEFSKRQAVKHLLQLLMYTDFIAKALTIINIYIGIKACKTMGIKSFDIQMTDTIAIGGKLRCSSAILQTKKQLLTKGSSCKPHYIFFFEKHGYICIDSLVYHVSVYIILKT